MNAISKATLESIKKHQPTVCVECMLFDWIKSPDGITGGKCALDPNIRPDEFEYGKLANRCPLRKEDNQKGRAGVIIHLNEIATIITDSLGIEQARPFLNALDELKELLKDGGQDA